MSEHNDDDWTAVQDDLDDPTEAVFAGHDHENDMLHLTIPEIAGAHTLAVANASGSFKARRQAKVMAWTLIVALLVVPLVLMLFSLG